MKLSHKHSNTKESHDSLLQVDGSGDGDISCGGVVGGAAMSVLRWGKEMQLRVNSPKQKRGGGASRRCDPIYFLFHKSRIYLCFFTRTVKPSAAFTINAGS